jgi:16S rRNA (guanine527-N7)-methyltransferase
MQIIKNYFPDLQDEQVAQFTALEQLYGDWNAKINVVSRKDITALYERHVLHSLGISKVQSFIAGAEVLDVGTGGGFPGIPLAIMFPEVQFHLIDAIAKKVNVVQEVANALELKNIKAEQIRAQQVKGTFDFIVSRAVTNMPDFVNWVKKRVAKKNVHDLKNGILYLKGGDLTEELHNFPKASVYNLNTFFKEPFFETKKVVHLPLKYKP